MHYKASQRIEAVRAGKTDTLDLSHLGLTELPNEVFSLPSLRVLNVRNLMLFSNQTMIDLMKESPFEQDPALLTLIEEAEHDLRQDLLVPKQLQTLDARISQLTALETLDLGFNQLTHLPETLSHLPNLRRLLLNDNQLTAVPTSLAQLVRLELLDLTGNPLETKPVLTQLDKYEAYKAHFKQQRSDAFRAKDLDMGVWLFQKEISYGLVL
ncbi:leucine rich repeat (LRR) protein [Spirosoma oryzae]|uniref:Leucine rich repeat (LRR) protein n=1 Tax=Spirosoma oryzae TaxID=1469603 RepID=A0A2T0RNF9_9BACT|nr:leucine-rich repeat domain-containing protein [Spirosoma oryzae]PRY22725.1 leucine rich repeat (LRR) protein [Spirosoma oryzae]